MKYTSVYAIASELQDQFNVEMEIHQVARQTFKALRLMKTLALQRRMEIVDVEDYEAATCCQPYKIVSVTRVSPNPSIRWNEIVFPPQTVWVKPEETFSFDKSEMPVTNYVPHIIGEYIDFVETEDGIKLNETGIKVAIEYTSIGLDEEGYPAIPESVQEGCLYYCLFVYYQPLFITGRINPNIFLKVEQWKNEKIRQAKNAYAFANLSKNELDKIFNIITSFDRKRFGYSI